MSVTLTKKELQEIIDNAVSKAIANFHVGGGTTSYDKPKETKQQTEMEFYEKYVNYRKSFCRYSAIILADENWLEHMSEKPEFMDKAKLDYVEKNWEYIKSGFMPSPSKVHK